MDVTNFKFPGVELNQEFGETPIVPTSRLGVVIIGQPNSITSESDAPALALGTVSSKAEIVTKFGEISSSNKMALACWLALSAANGQPVYYVSIKDTDANGGDFVAALDFLDKYSYVYSVVPLTTVTAKLTACRDYIVGVSENVESKIRRTLWCGIATGTGATTDAKATATITNKRAIVADSYAGAYRVQVVWSPGATYGGNPIPTECLPAAPAGMRAYEPAYRPISNLGYDTFSVIDEVGFTSTNLRTIGAAGIWIIDSNYAGTPINLRQLTADVSENLNKIEESIVANADSIALELCHIGEDLVGCSNISPLLIKSLSDTITGLMNTYLVNLTGNPYIGPQLLSWNLDTIYQHPTMLDHIYATITCEPPKPFNRFVMTLRIV